MGELLDSAGVFAQVYHDVFIGILRYVLPVLAVILLWRCARPLLSFPKEPEIWAMLCLPDGTRMPVTHWESVIGRSKRSDLTIPLKTISRNHAVLTRYDDGSWTVSDAGSKTGVKVNGKKVDICDITQEDVIELGGLKMYLEPMDQAREYKLSRLRTRASDLPTSMVNLLLLSLLQALFTFGFILTCQPQDQVAILTGFGGLFVVQWLLLVFYTLIRRTGFEMETIAFFLSTLGMAVLCTVNPQESVKQLLALVLGAVLFLAVGWSLRDLERAKVIRRLASVVGIGLLVVTLLFGKEIYGAKNWLFIGPFSIQPSELSKVCFVFAGASTLERMMNKKNLIFFIFYSALICGCLALMNDFGTALIFFVSFLVIAYMRSGSVGTLALAIAALAFAGVLLIRIAPHALRRFETWGHIWEDPFDAGYQQTQALMGLVSGGLWGLGMGNGWLKNLFAADTDVIFALVCEEWGLILGLVMVLAVVVLALFSLRSAGVGRSSFYTIGACTASAVLLMQAILNVLGTVDVLFLTGVTFPFVSNGGSSMMATWGLLAFIKAADTRQNASFAVKLPKKEDIQYE